MKTTIEIPDDLMMRVKLRAVQEGKKLKDTIAEILERGLARSTMHPTARAKHFPKPVKLKDGHLLTTEEIEAAINWGRE